MPTGFRGRHPAAKASASTAPQPAASASAFQPASNGSPSRSNLPRRVARTAACCPAASVGPPVASSHASISARRFENTSNRPCGIPAISGTCRPGRHSTPRVRVSSARNAAWNTSPAARACRYRSGCANAPHLPSAPSTKLAISTCQCSNGSPARLVRCRNAAPTTPDVLRRRGPTVDGSSPASTSSARFRSIHALLCEPRCTSIALRCNQPTASRTACSPASITAPWIHGSSDTAYSTLADFGTLNVASKPGTRRFDGLIGDPFGDRPPDPGRIPASTARRSSAATSPSNPNLVGTVADPRPGRLARTRVVGVQRLRHPRQLIRLLTHPQLRQRQHVAERAPDRAHDLSHTTPVHPQRG